MLSQNTTASGGGASNGDSSRPCCWRTASDCTKRSEKRARSASIIAAGIRRGRTLREKSTAVFIGAVPEVANESTPAGKPTLPFPLAWTDTDVVHAAELAVAQSHRDALA